MIYPDCFSPLMTVDDLLFSAQQALWRNVFRTPLPNRDEKKHTGPGMSMEVIVTIVSKLA